MIEKNPKENIKNSIEVEGQTVDEAIKKAVALFGVPREDILIKVVSEEKRGLFGMEGAKPAKIKVSLKKSNKSS